MLKFEIKMKSLDKIKQKILKLGHFETYKKDYV